MHLRIKPQVLEWWDLYLTGVLFCSARGAEASVYLWCFNFLKAWTVSSKVACLLIKFKVLFRSPFLWQSLAPFTVRSSCISSLIAITEVTETLLNKKKWRPSVIRSILKEESSVMDDSHHKNLVLLRLLRCSECKCVYTRPYHLNSSTGHTWWHKRTASLPLSCDLPTMGAMTDAHRMTHSQKELGFSLVLGWISAFKSEYSLSHFNQCAERRKSVSFSPCISYSLAYARKGKGFYIGKQIPRWFLSILKVIFFRKKYSLKN